MQAFFKTAGRKSLFFVYAAQILRCHRRTPGRMLHGIFVHKQRTRPFHGRVLTYHLILWRDGSPSPARSILYATASWMGRIVYRSTPFFTLPSLLGSYKQQSRHLYWTLLRFSRYPPTPATSQKSYSLFLYRPRSYP